MPEDAVFQATVSDECTLIASYEVCLFTTTLYVKAWYTASVAYDAPYNDLSLLQQLETFHGVDCHIAQAALHKVKGHLCYLSEDVVALSLFSNKVFSHDKRIILLLHCQILHAREI